jgi:hypothetical protein
VSHLQVGEGEQVHIPAGRVHSVATLGPRVCLSLYSTAAFGKGKEDKTKKKDVQQKRTARAKRNRATLSTATQETFWAERAADEAAQKRRGRARIR